MSRPVLKKTENYALWSTGAFGNRLRAWRSIGAWRESDFQGTVSLRYLGGAGGAWCAYDVASDQVETIAARWEQEGASASLIMVNESAPDEAIVLQGEYYNIVENGCIEGFDYSTAKEKMRSALKLERRSIRGLGGRFLLQRVMTPSSWSDFDELLAIYPDHVLEVSVYSRCLGDIPGRNALVWEIRKY